jgi:signal peptidase I
MKILLEIIVLAAIVVTLWPAPVGGRLGIVVVAGHSMEPTYALEDIVVTWKRPVEIGDVALFTVTNESGEKGSVIHRIADRDERGWITQGDNNGWLDPWVVQDDQILGQPLFALHGAGRLLEIYRSPLAIGVLAGAAVFLWLWPEPDDQRRLLNRTRSPRHVAPRVRPPAALTGLLHRALGL